MATSARTKTKNKPSLKSQGAGYSTTNSKGVTTYYKSSKDASGYNDTADGKNVKTSPGKALSSVNAMGEPIPVTNLMQQVKPADIPPKLVPNDPGNVVGANNAGLAGISNGMLTYDASSNQLVPNAQGATTAPTDNFSSLFNQYMGMQEAPPNTADIYAKEARAGQLKQKQESVNNYTAQLNSIVAKSQADQLRLEGQGRGVTDVIIGGQQAQINREAAIAALPVQAQLAAAQGDLEMAQQHVDKMFQIKSQDALAQYQYKSKVVDAVYNFATTQEQRRLDALMVKENRAYDMQKTNMSIANDWAKTAMEYGQSGIAGKLMALDPKSPTFSQDFASLTAKVQKPVAPTTSTQDWDFKDVGGVLYKINKRTGEISPADMGGVTSSGMSRPEMNLKKYDGLIADIGVATSLADSGVGAGLLERWGKSLFSSNPDFAQLENISDTVKTNLLALSDNPQLKKFFAAPMSDTDTRLLLGAESTLNPNKQTPAEYKKDLQAAADLFARAREAEMQSVGDTMQMSLMPGAFDAMTPDGQEVIFID